MNRDATGILTRHPANPILHVKDYPGIAQLYNPSPVQYGEETILLVSVVEHAATQSDEYPYPLYHHFIDNRVTKIDAWTHEGLREL